MPAQDAEETESVEPNDSEFAEPSDLESAESSDSEPAEFIDSESNESSDEDDDCSFSYIIMYELIRPKIKEAISLGGGYKIF